jgi:hypothetical protein
MHASVTSGAPQSKQQAPGQPLKRWTGSGMSGWHGRSRIRRSRSSFSSASAAPQAASERAAEGGAQDARDDVAPSALPRSVQVIEATYFP